MATSMREQVFVATTAGLAKEVEARRLGLAAGADMPAMPVPRKTQVEEQGQRLEIAMKQLWVNLAVLEDRLSMLIHPQVAREVQETDVDGMVAHAHWLSLMAEQVEAAGARVNGLVERLEI